MRVLAKAGALAIKELERKDGKGLFYVLEKSKKNEQTGQWDSESLFIKPMELAALAALGQLAFDTLAKEAAQLRNSKQEGGAEF